MTEAGHPSRMHILRMAWPIILANAAEPLLGLVDTAVIGNTGTTAELGAIALGSLIFTFVYWGFGFLRMGTTGFIAQAAGAKDETEVRATLGRALLLSMIIGLLLVALQWPLGSVIFAVLNGSANVESLAEVYFATRIWGAPAALATFVVMGVLIGLGRSKELLFVQLFLNGLNIGLDVLFAGVWDMGVKGIALGTVIAGWATLGLSLFVAYRVLERRRSKEEPFWPYTKIRDVGKLIEMLHANADIMIRTLFLIFGFAWFLDQSARFGDTLLAANHILLQFLSFSAFFLDGYAFVAESLVGMAIGGRQKQMLDLSVRRSLELAGANAVGLAIIWMALGRFFVRGLTDLDPVRQAAEQYLPYVSLYVLFAFWAFLLDGIFIGAMRTREMRNASILSVMFFLGAWWPLTRWAGNKGLWIAFIVYVIARAVTLGLYYPALRRSLDK